MVNGIKNSTNDEHVGNLVVTQADVPHVFRLRKEEQKVIIHALMNSGMTSFTCSDVGSNFMTSVLLST